MKKIITLLSVAFFTIAIFAFAAENTQPELRPAQVMQARVAWLTQIDKNLSVKYFGAVAKDAYELSAQTKRVGENLSDPLGKELTMAISLLANDISTAADKQDVETIKGKLEEIKGKCSECHIKIRDKK
jgi:hypothetical protein